MRVPLLNFEGGPGVPLLNFEGGPGVPLLNFMGVQGPTFKLWGGAGSRGPGPTFTPCHLPGVFERDKWHEAIKQVTSYYVYFKINL